MTGEYARHCEAKQSHGYQAYLSISSYQKMQKNILSPVCIYVFIKKTLEEGRLNRWKNQEKGMPMPVSDSSSVTAGREREESETIRQDQQERTEITTEQEERLRRNSKMKDVMAVELASMGFSPDAVRRILNREGESEKSGSSIGPVTGKGVV